MASRGVHAQAMHELESPAIADRALEFRTLNSTLQTKTNRAARNSREHVVTFRSCSPLPRAGEP